MDKKAIKCSSLFDSRTGEVLRDRMILIDGERIEDVLPQAEAVLDGREVIDLSGKFVTPGLIDCHVHLSSSILQCNYQCFRIIFITIKTRKTLHSIFTLFQTESLITHIRCMAAVCQFQFNRGQTKITYAAG